MVIHLRSRTPRQADMADTAPVEDIRRVVDTEAVVRRADTAEVVRTVADTRCRFRKSVYSV